MNRTWTALPAVELVVLASLAYVVWLLRLELVVLFAAVLFGVSLFAVACRLSERTSISHGAAVGIVYAFMLMIMGGFFYLISERLADQYDALGNRIPSALGTVENRISGIPVLSSLGREIADLRTRISGGEQEEEAARAPEPTGSEGSSVASRTMRVVRVTMRTLGHAGLILILSFYIAYDGRRYARGLLRLFPPDRRPLGQELLSALGSALPWWLAGRLISMAAVTVLTAPGLYLLGIPLAFILALIAGLFSFVPVLGPVAALIPAALVTLEATPDKIIWVLALYGAVQLLESWFITPRVQERMADVPALILLSAQLMMGVLVGIAGVMFSTPLALAAMVTVQVWYLRHALGEDVQPAGDHSGASSSGASSSSERPAAELAGGVLATSSRQIVS